MKRFLLVVLSVLCMLIAQAQDVRIDGVYYDLYPNELSAAVVNDGNRMDENGSGYVVTELVIPETITHEGVEYVVSAIGDYAFCNTKTLRSIVLSDSITKIGMRAFANCDSLKFIRIPKNVTMVGSYAFEASHALQQIYVDEDNSLYSSVDGCLCNKEGTSLIYAPSGRDSVIVAEGIVDIGRYAFAYCNLRYVELPSSLMTIGYYAFSYCNMLESIVVPDAVTDIKANAFRESVNLRSVVVGCGVEELGNYSFMKCEAMDTITILATEPPMTEDLSLSTDSCLLRVLKKSYSAYTKHKYWSKFLNISTLNFIELEVNNKEWGVVQGGGYYDSNSDVVVMAKAADGYEFVDWSDGITDNPRTINLASDMMLTANFAIKETLVDIELTNSDIEVYVSGNMLHVENIDVDFILYDLFGVKIYEGSDQALELNRGIYVIVFGKKYIKVVI